MLQGLKNEYLKAVGPQLENTVCNQVQMVFGDVMRETMQWNNLWKVILRYFYPTLDNIFQEGYGGTVRSNEVYSSEPSVLINDYVDFIMKSIFPENTPWKRAGFTNEYGMPIDRFRLDVETLRYADKAIDMCRYWLKEGGFYENGHVTLMHDTLLGNAAMQTVMSWDEINFIDVPISRLGISRDSVGRVETVAEIFKFHDWEILKKYGQAGLELFKKPRSNPANTPLPPNAIYGRSTFGNPAMGFSTQQAVGVKTQFNEFTKDVIRLFVPNAPYSLLPYNPEFLPEMGYLCFLVTHNTSRLLDVEAYPNLSFGVTRGTVVEGEKYGRGLGNQLLADVSVLNSKKKVEYYADSIQSQSPLVIKGSGFLKPPGKTLRPFQKLHLHQNTTLEPLYARAPLMQKAHTSYEAEAESVGRGFRKDRIDVALQDRMTADEYTQRKDASWGLFAPVAGRLYKQLAKPCLESLLNWLIVTEKLPPMPATLMSGKVKFNVELFSVFSYGQESEQGQNLARAFGPLLPLLETRPELLDNLDSDAFLRNSLSRHELSKFVPSLEEVRRKREARMSQEQALMKPPVDGVQQGRKAFDKDRVKQELTEQDGAYTAV